MIAVLPQTEHPHRSANGEAATVQSQLESGGCLIGGTLVHHTDAVLAAALAMKGRAIVPVAASSVRARRGKPVH